MPTNISSKTERRLTIARQAMEDLEKTARTQADSGTLPQDMETVERDVAGASKKFLSDTRDEALERRANKARKGPPPKIEDGWVTLRFRITLEQRDVIASAMQKAKEMQSIDGKLWKGVALEWVAADFLAGHGWPQDMSECQDALQAQARAEAALKGESSSTE